MTGTLWFPFRFRLFIEMLRHFEMVPQRRQGGVRPRLQFGVVTAFSLSLAERHGILIGVVK
ncbi:MAG TPA: hypothetical protein VFC56_13935 [Stellaceae bacterium]|nr:hypothetical protein [Stellaceae bacterium]